MGNESRWLMMHIQEVSQQLNLSKKAIMIYEQKGLIHPQKDAHGPRYLSLKFYNLLHGQ